MKRLVPWALAYGLVAATSALATPLIDVGDHSFTPGEVRTIAIPVSGGDAVEGLDFYIQIGDGGPPNEGTDTAPRITAVDIIGPGTVFANNNTGDSPFSAGPLMWTDATTTQPGSTVNATGTLAFLTIDATGTSAGESHALLLTGVADHIFPPSGVDTDFAGIVPRVINGTIHIVPEPSVVVLLGVGAAMLLSCAWRRRGTPRVPTNG